LAIRDRQAIVEALVIPFFVVVLDVLREGPPEMPFPDRNQFARGPFDEALPSAGLRPAATDA
jgi:hypothetical protein